MYNIMAACDPGTEPYESWEALDDPSVSRANVHFTLFFFVLTFVSSQVTTGLRPAAVARTNPVRSGE